MICFLIDDDVEDREIFLMALNAIDRSIQLITAQNGTQALAEINTNDFLPDYIFLDMNMPYMSGKECLIKLRAVERLKNVPIIIYSTVKYFEELASFGATGFISKRNSVTDLAKALSDVLNHSVIKI